MKKNLLEVFDTSLELDIRKNYSIKIEQDSNTPKNFKEENTSLSQSMISIYNNFCNPLIGGIWFSTIAEKFFADPFSILNPNLIFDKIRKNLIFNNINKNNKIELEQKSKNNLFFNINILGGTCIKEKNFFKSFLKKKQMSI